MRISALLFLFFVVFSCSNDFEIIEDYKDIPIIYGVISSSDPVQYIRLEKAFVDENTSALELAQIADSIYYPNATVKLIRLTDGKEYPLERFNAAQEGLEREEGIFPTDPNFLYRINTVDIQLIGGETYQLSIDRGEGALPIVTAETIVIEDSRMLTPGPTTNNIEFNYDLTNEFRWRGGENAAIYDLFLRFNYRERVNGGDFEQKSVVWTIAQNLNRTEFEFQGINFYSFLSGAIPSGSQYDRRFDNFDVILVSGGKEILEFNRIGSANLGITSSQDVPVFSNLSEGRGIFSSKYTEVRSGIGLSPKSIDSLRTGIFTGDLNFN